MRFLKSYKVYLAAILVVYGLGRLFFSTIEKKDANLSSTSVPLLLVKVIEQEAIPIDRTYTISAKTKPLKIVHIRSETSGRVLQTCVEKGNFIEQGTLLLQIDPREKENLLKKAEALLEQRSIEYKASEVLLEKGYEANSRFMATKCALEEAKAEHERMALSLDYTQVKAPLGGFLQTRDVEEGDFLSIGDSLATLIQNNPLLVLGYASETQMAHLAKGQVAYVHFKDHSPIEGKVTYISQEADNGTRTYAVEVEIPNPDYKLPAGMSASLLIPYEVVKVHQVSPSVLCLDKEGALGVKVVDADQKVCFYKADIVQSELSSVSLAGLPDKARIICQGQDFVLPGQTVATQL